MPVSVQAHQDNSDDTPHPDLQRTFFRMKRNFEKKQKNIAREYSKGKKEGENSCYITAAAW